MPMSARQRAERQPAPQEGGALSPTTLLSRSPGGKQAPPVDAPSPPGRGDAAPRGTSEGDQQGWEPSPLLRQPLLHFPLQLPIQLPLQFLFRPILLRQLLPLHLYPLQLRQPPLLSLPLLFRLRPRL